MWNFQWCLQRFGDFLGGWRIFVLAHPWNCHIWTPKVHRLISCLTLGIWQGNWLVWRSRPYTLYGKTCASGRSRLVTWPPGSRHFLFHSDPNSPWSNIKSMPALFRPAFFLNFHKIVKRKCAGNQEKQWLHWAQVRKFYLIVKVGYYPWLSLACASV